jgi:hypothetical protein
MIEKHNLSVAHGCGITKIEHTLWIKACLFYCVVMFEHVEQRSSSQPLQIAQTPDNDAILLTAYSKAKDFTHKRRKWEGDWDQILQAIFSDLLPGNHALCD